MHSIDNGIYLNILNIPWDSAVLNSPSLSLKIIEEERVLYFNNGDASNDVNSNTLVLKELLNITPNAIITK